MATHSQTPWEKHKTAITQLYAVKTLPRVIDEMRERHGFTASMKQWKTQVTKWGLDKKNIKPAEYRAMTRKKRERKENDPTKATQFILHGVEVPHHKIARFESRERRNKGINGRQGDALTPPGLACRTPPIEQGPGGVRGIFMTGVAATCVSAASDGCGLVQTQLVPDDLTVSWEAVYPRLSTRSPSLESFDWFGEYINYSESINGSPITSGNPLMEMLLGFQKVLDDYENERAYKSFTEDINLEFSCNKCRIRNTFLKLRNGIKAADQKMTPVTIENWAQATVRKVFQSKEGTDTYMVLVGKNVGQLYLDLGRVWEAKLYLEQTILEMKRLDILYDRKDATLSLAECYSDLGNKQQAVDLLKVFFKTDFPKIVAVSYLFLENYCAECQIQKLKTCYSKIKDDLAQDVNDTGEYEWEEDKEEMEV